MPKYANVTYSNIVLSIVTEKETILFASVKDTITIHYRKLLKSKFLAMCREERLLCITVQPELERELAQKEIATISLQVLLSMANEHKQDESWYADLFSMLGLNYSCIAYGTSMVLYSSEEYFWQPLAVCCDQCLEKISAYGMEGILMKEIAVLPILHEIFDKDFHLDRCVYAEWRQMLEEKISRLKSENTCEAVQSIQKYENCLKQYAPEKLYVSNETDVVRCSFHQIGTRTFRISTHRPNIQGLPAKLKHGLRPCHDGNVLMELDIEHSQVMLFGALANETKLLTYCENDLYCWLAATFFQKGVGSIVDQERLVAKRSLLMMLNGAGQNAIREDLKKHGVLYSLAQVQNMKDTFFRAFPNMKNYWTNLQDALSYGLPTGMFWEGSRVTDGYKHISKVLQHLEAELLIDVLIASREMLYLMNAQVYLIIHDAIILEVPLGQDVKQLTKKMNEILLSCFLEIFPQYRPISSDIQVKFKGGLLC